MEHLKKWFRDTNGFYLPVCLLCSAISVVTLTAMGRYQLGGFALDEAGQITGLGGYAKAVTQLFAAVTGGIFALILSRVDYRTLLKQWKWIGLALWGLVLPTLFLHNVSIGSFTIGYDVGGTGNFSWYRLGALSFQPSELAKTAFILIFAVHLNHVRERLNHPLTMLGILLHLMLPAVAIHLQGDDGSALVFAAIGLTMLFSAGISLKYILAAVAAGVAGAAVLVQQYGGRILKSYQFARIMAVFEPDNPDYSAYTYQQNKGVLSAGAGQLTGNGLFQENHSYIPYAWNDFIFDYIGEAFGFVGCVLVLLLLFWLAFRTLRTAWNSPDFTGSLICMGLFGALFVQTLLNVGMNLQILPVVGVTLPFFSAGGSSVWMLYLCVGLVLSVHRHSRDTVFEEK